MKKSSERAKECGGGERGEGSEREQEERELREG